MQRRAAACDPEKPPLWKGVSPKIETEKKEEVMLSTVKRLVIHRRPSSWVRGQLGGEPCYLVPATARVLRIEEGCELGAQALIWKGILGPECKRNPRRSFLRLRLCLSLSAVLAMICARKLPNLKPWRGKSCAWRGLFM